MPNRDNARAWYEYALRTGDDSVARFMMHWIAFNWSYSEYHGSEKRQIERLCEDRFESLKSYHPFNDPDAIEVFIREAVVDGRGRSRRHDNPRRPSEMDPWQLHEGILDSSVNHELERTQCLLLTIYQVRCNLFHGSKNPGYPRDKALIQSAATIMQGYMEALLGIDSSSREMVD